LTDLDLRLLRYFVRVTERGSFTDAAAQLHVSQPALSQGIRRLETLVGAPLIVRGPRGSSRALQLTRSGAVLLAEAKEILVHAERAMKSARRSADRVELHIGFGTSTPRALTRAVLDAAADIGHVEGILEYIPWGEEVAALRRGDVDVTFIQAPRDFAHSELDTVPVQSMRRLAVFHAGHPLTSRQELMMADLADEPIIDAGSDRDYWIVNPRPDGRTPNAVAPAARTVDEMLAFVSAGRGMAITTTSVAERNASTDLVFVPIRDIEAATVFLAANRADRRPELAAIIEQTTVSAAATQQTPGASSRYR
jgi:DNA-binding transcriptional LysR family regulator